MISHRYKCIFIHIPKCGGTSIEDVIWPGPRSEADLWKGQIDETSNKYQTSGLQHLSAKNIRAEVGEQIFSSYFKFAIVRNPWDKVISQFLYLKRRRRDFRRYLGVTRFVSLKRYLEALQKVDHVHWAEQYRFLHDDDGTPLVDYIGRFERLDAEFATIAQTLGLSETALPHAKKSERRNYRDYYTAETRELVAVIYRRDIETFGYEF